MKNLFTRAPAAFAGAAALLAGGLLAAPASAQGEAESMMVLGGYSNYTVSFTKYPGGATEEQDGDIHIYNNTEIFFNGSAETDGGLQVSARVELEGHSTDDQIDEHYITVSGGFGSFEVGANDSADERLAKGIFYNSTAVDYWYTNADVVPSTTPYRGLGQNDGLGLVYTTPSLGGATFAIGYKPKPEGNANDPTDRTKGEQASGDENYVSFGAKYDGDMDGITIGASFGYYQHDIPARDFRPANPPATVSEDENGNDVLIFDEDGPSLEMEKSAWGIGINIGFGDTTLYGRYQSEETDETGPAKTDEFEIGSLAVSHVVGPAKLGLGWVQAKTTDGDTEAEEEDTMIIGSVDYTLGSGVTLGGYVAWGEAEEVDNTKESGSALGAALNLAF